MCFHLRNMSRISHNMSMTHTQPDVLPIQPIMSMIILQLIYYIIVIVYHTIMILWGKSRWLRILSCAIYVKKKMGDRWLNSL